jgi:hypothetical protein
MASLAKYLLSLGALDDVFLSPRTERNFHLFAKSTQWCDPGDHLRLRDDVAYGRDQPVLLHQHYGSYGSSIHMLKKNQRSMNDVQDLERIFLIVLALSESGRKQKGC